MLKLIDIKKDYPLGKNDSVHALKGISISFPDSGFIAILGPSGCGKTTLLNIISGLDRYTSGDLIIDGISTRNYSDRMWDDYRNKKAGMIFQSYNLIPHLTLWENVAMPLTLAGYSRREKKRRGEIALADVGLAGQGKKYPNQLSGGQQQRVAIARSIINNPSIILADEPTGALDSVTSIQVMDILESLSRSRLVIMVTHNRELAYQYADRIITMKDGEIISDQPNESSQLVGNSSAPSPFKSYLARHRGASRAERVRLAARRVNERPGSEEPVVQQKHSASGTWSLAQDIERIDSEDKGANRKSRMTFWTAFSISLRNIMTKKGRTILTSIASSFGIIGVGLVLAVANGFNLYIERTESESLSKFPITISHQALGVDSDSIPDDELERYPDDDVVHVSPSTSTYFHLNNLTPEYYEDYLGKLDPSLYSSINLNYSTVANVVTKVSDNSYTSIQTGSSSSMISSFLSTSSSWQELPGDEDFILSQYDLIDGTFPSSDDPTGLLITVDSYNRISADTLVSLGYDKDEFAAGKYTDLTFEDLKSKTYRLFSNDDYYTIAPGKTNEDIRGIALKDPNTYDDLISKLAALSNLKDADSSQLTASAKDILSLFVDIPSDLSPADLLVPSLTLKRFTDGQITWKECLTELFPQLQAAGIEFRPVTSMDTYQAPARDSTEMRNLYEFGNIAGQGNPDVATDLHVVGVLRLKSSSAIGILGNGIYYTSAFSKRVAETASSSKIAAASRDRTMIDLSRLSDDQARQLVSSLYSGDTSVAMNILAQNDMLLTNYSVLDAFSRIDSSQYMEERGEIGADSEVSSITIYPKDFDSKAKITAYLDQYNEGKDKVDQVIYTDLAAMVTSAIGTMVDVTSTVLIVFASISLVVSSVMIGIIIYVSVVERTKEIGTLRSLGARKKDVSRLFIMESVTIGFLAGAIGVLFTYVLSVPINLILNHVFSEYDLGSIALLNPAHALILIIVSMVLTYIAGLIPSALAGKKDPVLCLRSE